jgi:hypothetical protein
MESQKNSPFQPVVAANQPNPLVLQTHLTTSKLIHF